MSKNPNQNKITCYHMRKMITQGWIISKHMKTLLYYLAGNLSQKQK